MTGRTHTLWMVSRLLATVMYVLARPAVAAAQSANPDSPTGIRFAYGATLAIPLLDERAGAPFQAIGEPRVGPGIQVGVGYGVRRWEVSVTADLAGLDIGEAVERDGIGMGRESLILRAIGLTASWRPARWAWRRWEPVFSVGLVGESLDNVSLRADQLPPESEAATSVPGEEGATRPAGIGGTGTRLGIGAERPLGPTLGLRLGLSGDYVRFRDLTFDGTPLDWGGGTGWVPRLSARLEWAP